MPVPYERHFFVCTNQREDGHPRGCCASKGSVALRAALKDALKREGLRGRMRVNAAACLDTCEDGISIVVYPEGVWYRAVTLDDVEELVTEHMLGDRVVERLRVPNTDRKTK